MPDIFSPEKRSEIMSLVKSRGNKRTEIALLQIMRTHRIAGWRRHTKIFGTPDFVFAQQKVAIFVDGCFWHNCPKHSTSPVTNAVFWNKKLSANSIRDRLVNRTLRGKGWIVLRFWQHELSKKNAARVVRRLKSALDRVGKLE